MNKKEIFVSYIKEYLESDLENFYPREKKFEFLDFRKVYTIFWPRRAWKTFYCYQIIDELLKNWIEKSQTLYVYLENDEFYPLNLQDLNLLLDTYFEIVSFDKNKKYYVFLDEIQEVENWEKFALKVYSNFKNVELILTGSSSKLLSKEISSWLRWKAFSTEILPLDLKEYLQFKGFSLQKQYSKTKFLQLKNLFNQALIYGFFPEVVLASWERLKLNILQDYFDLIFYKDVIERYGFKNLKKIKTFRKLIVSYMWDFLNYSKLAKQLDIEYNTLLSWFEAFADAYFVFELKNFDLSVKKQIKSFSKIYIIDNGFYTLNYRYYKQDWWKYFENFVFLEFRKQGFKENENIFYFKNKEFDVDFILFADDTYLVNVVYQLTDDNFSREVEKLAKACKKFNVKGKLVYYENFTNFDGFGNIEFVRFDNLR